MRRARPSPSTPPPRTAPTPRAGGSRAPSFGLHKVGRGRTMTVTRFQDLPLAERDREWDVDAADKRVRAWADAENEPDAAYRDAHLWYDGDKPDNFGSYKLLIADVVGGSLKAVPRGIMAAGNVLQG